MHPWAAGRSIEKHAMLSGRQRNARTSGSCPAQLSLVQVKLDKIFRAHTQESVIPIDAFGSTTKFQVYDDLVSQKAS
jgi:hypothetical protein